MYPAVRDAPGTQNRLLPRLTGAIGLLWLLTGFYGVQVDEQAIVRRFGAVVADRVSPGLHLGFPWGIDRVDRVKVREQKRLSIGFELPDQALGRPVTPARREYLTGDNNLINVELLVQYTVREPRAYLFANVDTTETLRLSAETAVAMTVAGQPVDLLLTTGKLETQAQVQRAIQQAADRANLGISISAVNIQAITPPVPVADAFRDVSSAREDRDRIIKEAESYANATLPAAEGEAAKMHEESLGYHDQKIRQATGDADRFVEAYQAYRLSPDVTNARLYLEAIEQILPRVRIVSVDRKGGQSPVDLNLLPRPSGAAGGNGTGSSTSPAPPITGTP